MGNTVKIDVCRNRSGRTCIDINDRCVAGEPMGGVRVVESLTTPTSAVVTAALPRLDGTELELLQRSRPRVEAYLATFGSCPELDAIKTFISRVCNSLDWTLEQMIEQWKEVPVVDEHGNDTGGVFEHPETPPHGCGYELAPDEGACDFCESFANAYLISGLYKE